MGEEHAEHEPDRGPEHESDSRLLRREERCVREHLDQQRAVPPRGLEELADDVVEVGEGLVVDLEASDREARGLAEPLEPFPQGVEGGEDDRHHPDLGEHRTPGKLAAGLLGGDRCHVETLTSR